MLNLKKTAVAVLALGSSAVFAGTMGPVCAPGNVTVPCEKTAWDLGAQALYLQPVYAVEGNYPTVVSNPTSLGPVAYNSLNPDWQWGFMVEGSYHFGMGNDINVNWYRVHNTNTTGNLVQLQSQAPDVASATSNSNSVSMNPQWDQVDVELGQHIDFGDMKYVRLHGGVEYARVATNASFQANAIAFNVNSNSTYNGFGPRGGIDGTYKLGNGFGVYGKGAGSILVGPSSANMSAAINGVAAPQAGTYSKTLLVPELEAKLGITYDYAMAQGDVTLDIGWMWINYFNAQQNISGDVYDSRSTSSAILNHSLISSTDFGLQGLYFGAKWVGNV